MSDMILECMYFFLLASSFGKKGHFPRYSIAILILLHVLLVIIETVMTGYYVTLKYQAKPRTLA